MSSNRSEKSNGRMNYITLMQIVGMILIVLSHSVSSRVVYPEAILSTVHSIQMIGLTAFMWCSGYLLVRTDSLRKYGYWKYIAKRAVRLLIPYFVIQLLMLAPKYLIARLTNAPMELSIPKILTSFLYPRDGILPHLWFLPTLMILCLLSFLLVYAAKHLVSRCIVLAVSLGLLFLPEIPNLLSVNDVKLYLFWYFLGISTAFSFSEEGMKRLKNILFPIVAAVGYILFAFIDYIALADFFKGLCSIVFLISVAMLIDRRGGGLGAYTFPIYILSLPVQNIIEVLLARIGMTWAPITLIMFVFGIAVPFVIALLVKRIEQKWKYKPISRCIGL